jgi:tetratricopeptide (TPR) repeat protein
MIRVLLTGLLVAACACAQPRGGANLQANMSEIAQSLGVECQYCHSAERGSGQPEPRKDIARAMMAMTREINEKIAAATGKTGAENTADRATEVKCITCHRGVAIPRQITEILTRTLAAEGRAAAVGQYRDLRTRYYGKQAYDFSETMLIGIAEKFASGRPDDSIALMQLNLEFYPQSVRTLQAIAFAYTRKFDDPSAIKYLEMALALEPQNGIVQGQLEQLKSYQRRR